MEPFRLNHTVVDPGGITYVMALPWQNDFFQCADNWWPVPRPNSVTRQGMSNQSFIAGAVRQRPGYGGQLAQTRFYPPQRCATHRV